MNIGFIGLGKLGLPVALAIESKGHHVVGYDVSPRVQAIISSRKLPYKEEGAAELLRKSRIELFNIDGVVRESDIIFVPIQTPHDPRFEGITRIPQERADFNYEYLKAGVKEIADSAERQTKHIVLIIISTVLPGTITREIKPLLNQYTHLVYNPFFIAMGTTINDFLRPEFVLFGTDEPKATETAKEFYKTIHDRPVFETDINTAELTKVAYNTYLGQKIVFANAMMEICEKTGADCDDLVKALSLATDRLISARYMKGGMGDGGGCHPRDNIAMSFLAKKLRLSHDIFYDQMKAREDQTEWLASIIQDWHEDRKLPVVIYGKAYKPESNLTVGSPALLLAELLREKGISFTHFDAYVDMPEHATSMKPSIFFIATQHVGYKTFPYPKGSVIIDPWGYIPDRPGCEVVRIGRHG